MFQDVDTHLLAYFAGVIDSDGSISIIRVGSSKGRVTDWAITITVSQVTTDALDLFKAAFGGSLTCGKKYPLWRWQASYQRAVNVIAAIRPYLRIKYRQADLALAFHAKRQKSMTRSYLSMSDIDMREGYALAVQEANIACGRVGRVRPSSRHVPGR